MYFLFMLIKRAFKKALKFFCLTALYIFYWCYLKWYRFQYLLILVCTIFTLISAPASADRAEPPLVHFQRNLSSSISFLTIHTHILTALYRASILTYHLPFSDHSPQ